MPYKDGYDAGVRRVSQAPPVSLSSAHTEIWRDGDQDGWVQSLDADASTPTGFRASRAGLATWVWSGVGLPVGGLVMLLALAGWMQSIATCTISARWIMLAINLLLPPVGVFFGWAVWVGL